MIERKRLSDIQGSTMQLGHSKAQMKAITRKRLATVAEQLKKQREERLAKAQQSSVSFEAKKAPIPVKPTTSPLRGQISAAIEAAQARKRRYTPVGIEIKTSSKLYRALQVFTNGEWGTIKAEVVHAATPPSKIFLIDQELSLMKERWTISGYFGDAAFRIATVPAPGAAKIY